MTAVAHREEKASSGAGGLRAGLGAPWGTVKRERGDFLLAEGGARPNLRITHRLAPALEQYLRDFFEVHKSVKYVALRLKSISPTRSPRRARSP
ncbi:hypothetical protein OAO87_03305 [bacterium]|nr:hypothetical protein [bacterium]